ncbi:TIM barrel protein [Spongiactinospora sp. TRM90649]|uniref:TIM barrel protein n=1 Tax=Spongiactinospora sp. TRM90649 TaxID=3031114 RepID=UPI0023F80317|nr:TIM barrel protein [Spongiactinospora sp. TRM90649]MDF5754731.1 TIM barrel protein [Spongiactinospora sp. TRM90649]
MKIAGAPMSWGVCEVPGWGYQLDRTRVLAEMRDLGLTATELGPPGFLPPSPARRTALLGEYGLRGVAGLVPLVLHDPDLDPMPEIRASLRGFQDGDVEVAVFAAVTGGEGYDIRPELDGTGWKTLTANLDQIVATAKEFDREVALYPHFGTMIQTRDEVKRVLDESRVQLCLDTGHLLVGGTDPVSVVGAAPERVGHVHLKDVDGDLADEVAAGNLTYTEAVRAGLFRPLGEGEVDVGAIVTGLTLGGYDGWYVLEQDTILTEPPPPGEGPKQAVHTSLEHLASLT